MFQWLPEGEKIRSACLPCGIQGYSIGAAESFVVLTARFRVLFALPFPVFEKSSCIEEKGPGSRGAAWTGVVQFTPE